MPTMDIPTQGESKNKEGFGTGIPTPILLIAVGGGLGLIVFLTRKSGTPSDSENGTLMPNTAVMLGSLQQGILELQGKVTMGDADLSSQLSGVGSNLGAQIDANSAQTQQALADYYSNISGSLDTLQGSSDALATAIAQLGTQNVGLAQSLTEVLKNINYVRSDVQSNIQGTQNVMGGIYNLQNNQSYILALLNALGQAPKQAPQQYNANLDPYTNSGAVIEAARKLDPGFDANKYLDIMGNKSDPSSVEHAVRMASNLRLSSWSMVEPTFKSIAYGSQQGVVHAF